VRALLLAEVDAGKHLQGAALPSADAEDDATRSGGATLSDPSGAMALLWLARSLKFTLRLTEGLLDGARDAGGSPQMLDAELQGDEHLLVESHGAFAAELLREQNHITSGAIKAAYDAVIRPFHSWLLRKTFDMCASQVPSFSDVVDLLGSGLGDADREVQILADMALFCREGSPVVAAIEALYSDLQLEDLRRV